MTAFSFKDMKNVFIFIILLAFPAVTCADESPQTVLDYYRLLPKAYQDYYADAGEKRTEIDTRNGYIAVHTRGWDGPLFEMALFRDASGGALLLVTNVQSDPACLFYQSYALQFKGSTWQNTDLLPRLRLEDFFDQGEDIALLRKVPEYYSLHYRLPRHGTEIRVSFGDICDMADSLNAEELERFRNLFSDKVYRFQWDKTKGIFRKLP